LSCVRYRLRGWTCLPNDSKNPSPLRLPATPPITQFCAVGGFRTSIESAVEFQITTLAPAQPCNDPALSSRNAARSSGPKTDAGKARSAKNALKHGMAAASSAPLPDEDPEAYTNALQEWFDDLRPVGVAERTGVERACRAAFNLDRCARSEDAVIANRTRHATQDFMNDEHARAEKLGLKLVHDPIGRCSFPTKDPAVLRLMAIRVAADPPELRRTLESSLEGVEWLLNRWSILIRILETEGYWHYPEKFDAIRQLGRRPEDVLHDPVVDRIMVSCNVLHPHRWELKDDCIQQRST
jgi:hypothetical protein